MNELSKKAKAFSVDSLLGSQDVTATLVADQLLMRSPEQNIMPGRSTALKSTIKAELCCQELWKQFHVRGTEMIITKAGRRMFPTIKVRFTGLIDDIKYLIFMDIIPVDNKRYRYLYHSSQWIPAGNGDSSRSRLYILPESPVTGQLLKGQGDVVTFDKLKLTNNKNPVVNGQISLFSMHKYIPRIHIIPNWNFDVCNVIEPHYIESSIKFIFPETAFITVTAYQNQQITKLKIASNPFAKGFREASKHSKRSFHEEYYQNKQQPCLISTSRETMVENHQCPSSTSNIRESKYDFNAKCCDERLRVKQDNVLKIFPLNDILQPINKSFKSVSQMKDFVKSDETQNDTHLII